MSSRSNKYALPALLLVSLLASLLLSPAASAAGGGGKLFMTVEEALATAFKDCKVERTTEYLSAEQGQRVDKLAGKKSGLRVCFPYIARKNGKIVATAYFDTHKVRTKRETVMVVVTPEGKVQRLELLAFAEPVNYIPNARWYAQFLGKQLDSKLGLKGSIKGVTGATLTARATTAAVRRILAVHKVLAAKKTPPKGGDGKRVRAESTDNSAATRAESAAHRTQE